MTTPTRETMTYKQGKIYKIEPIVEHEEGEIYIGSTTCKYLSQRMKSHRKDYNRWKEGKRGLVTSYNLFEMYGIENCNILLLENVSCENINELRAREGYYIRILQCVNKVIPLRTHKEYFEDNKEVIKEKRKEHYNENKDKILEQQKEYRDANLDKERERSKIYYENNKDKIAEKAKEHYDESKNKILQQCKEYRDANLDKEKERSKKYYEKNKATIAERRRLKRQAKKEAEIKT